MPEAASVAVTGEFERDLRAVWESLQGVREDMPATDMAGWREVYEKALPYARSIKDLAAVMVLDIEVALGEEALAGGERRGGDQSHEPRDLATRRTKKAADMKTYRRTQLAKHKPEVEAYKREAAAAGKRPSVNGALARIESPAAWKPREAPRPTKPSRAVKRPPERPLPANTPLWAFLGTLRKEIARRRKENHDHYKKSPWNPDSILKRKQTELLDWIEEQLALTPQ